MKRRIRLEDGDLLEQGVAGPVPRLDKKGNDQPDLLGLQRAAGNEAVSGLVQGLSDSPMGALILNAPGALPHTVQRRTGTAPKHHAAPAPAAPIQFRCSALEDGRVPGGTFVDDIDTRGLRELTNKKYWPWEIPSTWQGWSKLAMMSNPTFWNTNQIQDATEGVGIDEPLPAYPGTFEDVSVSVNITAKVTNAKYVPAEDAPSVGGGSHTSIDFGSSTDIEDKTSAEAKVSADVGDEKKAKAGAELSGGHESGSKVGVDTKHGVEASQEIEKRPTHVFEVELEYTVHIKQYIKTGFWTTIGTIGITNLVNWIRQN